MAICHPCLSQDDLPFRTGTDTSGRVCRRCGAQGYWVLDQAVDNPRLVEDGESRWFSSSHHLARPSDMRIVWDVNLYYRDLGVPVDATRVDLRRAYQERIAEGGDPVRLTFVIKQLLDPEVRSAYDRCEIGELFFDRELARAVVAKAVRAAREAGSPLDSDEERVDLDEILGRAISMLDTDDPMCQDGYEPAKWGRYAWGVPSSTKAPLDMWMQVLAEVFWRAGIHARLGVGVTNREHPTLANVGSVKVAFLPEGVTPSLEYADCILQQFTSP